MDGDGEEIVFSANFACPHCGYSMQELEPRLFSFNNPAGACATLVMDLGVQQYFDPDASNRQDDSAEPSRRSNPRLGSEKLLLLSRC